LKWRIHCNNIHTSVIASGAGGCVALKGCSEGHIETQRREAILYGIAYQELIVRLPRSLGLDTANEHRLLDQRVARNDEMDIS
jgi:hypothetical protein